jgi:Ca-activated chloride channel family protein
MRTKNRCGTPTTLWRIWCFAQLLSVLLAANCVAQSSEPLDTIRVDSDLVDLKVSVVNVNPQTTSPTLQQKDFLVLEDDTPQEIAFFAAADTPFDLVLLLDLSGSTADKVKLIRQSAKRFAAATRPLDRVAVVTFTDVPLVVSDLTWDRGQLKSSIDEIEKPVGGTNFWDSLRYVLETLLSSGQASRRSAVVVMTDGVDNALPDVFGEGSRTNFDELLNIVAHSDALLFPIYLNTEEEESKRHRTPRVAYALAREQLARLAEVCGTTVYSANKLKDLETVYDQVIRDLATVYSIGYRPSNTQRDGKWRSVTVKLARSQNVMARTKRGYFAKLVGTQ